MTHEAPTCIDLPVKLGDKSAGVRSFPMQLPYDAMRFLQRECGLYVSRELVRSFWDHLDAVADPWAQSTREFRKSVGDNVIPLGLYGDEANIGLINAPYNQVYGIFMSVTLFRPSATRISRYLLFSIATETILSTVDTLYPVLEAIKESMNKLTEEGVDGIYYLTAEIRGDQAFFRKVFRHRAWWLYSNPCFRCKATLRQGHRNYCLYEGWTDSKRTTEEFVREQLPQPVCPWADLHFFHVDLLKHCTLHILNLGLLAISNGGALLLVCKTGFSCKFHCCDIKGPTFGSLHRTLRL